MLECQVSKVTTKPSLQMGCLNKILMEEKKNMEEEEEEEEEEEVSLCMCWSSNVY